MTSFIDDSLDREILQKVVKYDISSQYITVRPSLQLLPIVEYAISVFGLNLLKDLNPLSLAFANIG